MSKRIESRSGFNSNIPLLFCPGGHLSKPRDLGTRVQFLVNMRGQATLRQWNAVRNSVIAELMQDCFWGNRLVTSVERAALEWIRTGGCYPWEKVTDGCPTCGRKQLCQDKYHG